MWPSIPAFNSFRDVPCPGGAACDLPTCIFMHQTNQAEPLKKPVGLDTGPPSKLNDGPKKSAIEASQSSPTFVEALMPKEAPHSWNKAATKTTDSTVKAYYISSDRKNARPSSATRPISPPQKPVDRKPEPKKPEVEVEVPLTPRKLGNEPVPFMKRLAMLKLLQQYMAVHNDKVSQSPFPEIRALALSGNQLNKLAVDEEEKIGLEHRAVYSNVIKQRLLAIKKMGLEEWNNERRAVLKPKPMVKEALVAAPIIVDTGLTAEEEVKVLSVFVTPQAGLDAHGYVTVVPKDWDVKEAGLTLVSADHWQECERCSSRFQVFPDRREEDGALTSGNKCRHHWGKKIYPKSVRGLIKGPTRWACCNDSLGQPGCSVKETHVFKYNDANLLSTVMPFIETPKNDKADPNIAVCFDCEMGYTTKGLELLRLTAISWPTHKPLLDILVRPIGQILDLNTRFSGVSVDQYFNAKPYDPKDRTIDAKDLRIVDSPYVARNLFLSLISSDTPLIGHALENDLNSIRLVHPIFVDTVYLYPHRAGMPVRNGLKYLAKNFLNLDIQQGGEAGHDSFEDARTTGELVRLKVATEWKRLKDQGWVIRSDGMYPPMPTGSPPPPPPPTETKPTEKRKTRGEDSESDTNESPPTKKQKED